MNRITPKKPVGDGLVFDDDPFTKWLQLGEADVWLSHHFPEGRAVQSYSVMSGDDVPERDPSGWRPEGSMNGLGWETLDTRQGVDFPQRRQQKSFQFSNEATCTHYQFYITENSRADAVQLQEMERIGLDPNEDWQYNPAAGSYWVAAVQQSTGLMSSNRSGFSLTMPAQAAISEISEGTLGVTPPDPDLTYLWYT